MANTNYHSIDEYIAAQPEANRAKLTRVRNIIRKAMPKAEEAISYQIPAYKVDGKTALYFAGWKSHFSLYPIGAALLAEFKGEIDPYVASKGTLRFALDEPIPANLIQRIAKFRAKNPR